MLVLLLSACANQLSNPKTIMQTLPKGMPNIDFTTAIYEVPVNDGVSYQEVVDSLKTVSEGMNFGKVCVIVFGLDNWLAQADSNKTNTAQKMVLSQLIF